MVGTGTTQLASRRLRWIAPYQVNPAGSLGQAPWPTPAESVESAAGGSSPDLDLADLQYRLGIRVVGHVAHDLGAVQGQARLQRFDRGH